VKKIPTVLSFNEVRPEERGLGSAQVRRPFPEFGNVSGLGVAAGTSLYHALFIQVKRQYSSGLSFTTNYTLARQLDNISYRRSDYDRMADYGPSRLELRHRFVWGSVYELPWGPGKAWLKDGPFANILGGWSVGTIVTLQGRPPLSLSSVANTCNCFSTGTQGVNLIGNPKKDTADFDPNRDTWFNTAAFASPAQFGFGNAGAGILTVPGLVNVDSTFAKTVKFGERYGLEMRGEFFNLFNHANFNGPNTTFGSAAFGRVTSTLPGRISQVGVKLYF
jgi:hypothetical protein